MGIQGLLPLLKSIMAPIHVEQLRGQTVAVDAYSWLHKGAFSCSTQLCKGLPTSKHIEYCMQRVNLLRHHGVKPILVFDGGILPIKIEQETKRSRTRKENLARAMEHETMDNSVAAFECYHKAVDISPSIAFELIQVLKREKVDYIVAPYEADAQMTFLSINCLVDAVITEDSDLIPFGCSRIIFKMDKFGHGVEFQDSKLWKNKDLDLTGFTKQMLLEMCILSGCDYLPSLPGIGLKRAHVLVKRLKSYENVIKHLKNSAVYIPPSFEEMFRKAIWAFQHQRVYDPAKEDLVHLLELTQCPFEDLDFLGPWLPQDVAKGIAKGDIDPMTKMPFKGKSVENTLMLNRSYPSKPSALLSEKKSAKGLASAEARRNFRPPNVVQKYLVAPDSSFQSSVNCIYGSPASAEDATGNINSTQGNPDDLVNGDDIPCSDVYVTDTAMTLEEDKFTNLSQKQDVNNLIAHYKQNSSPTCKPILALHKEMSSDHKTSVVNETESPTDRKVVVRSSYFKRKPSDSNSLQEQNDCATDIKENNNCISSDYLVSKDLESVFKKRKSPEDKEMENPPSKNARTSVYHREVSDLKNKGSMVAKGGDFACDISYVDIYAGIAEKSIDKFATLISSSRCPSSGGHASDHRAPLSASRGKTVANTIEESTFSSKK